MGFAEDIRVRGLKGRNGIQIQVKDVVLVIKLFTFQVVIVRVVTQCWVLIPEE